LPKPKQKNAASCEKTPLKKFDRINNTFLREGKGLTKQTRLEYEQPACDEHEYYEPEVVGIEIIFFVSHLKNLPH
jgi:hypothetical protein